MVTGSGFGAFSLPQNLGSGQKRFGPPGISEQILHDNAAEKVGETLGVLVANESTVARLELAGFPVSPKRPFWLFDDPEHRPPRSRRPPLVSAGAQAKMSYVKPRRPLCSGVASMAAARASAFALMACSL